MLPRTSGTFVSVTFHRLSTISPKRTFRLIIQRGGIVGSDASTDTAGRHERQRLQLPNTSGTEPGPSAGWREIMWLKEQLRLELEKFDQLCTQHSRGFT